MQILTQIIAIVDQNKVPLGIVVAWLTHAYPTIVGNGGILGIAKTFLVGAKAAVKPIVAETLPSK